MSTTFRDLRNPYLNDPQTNPGALKRVLSRRDLILYGLVILTPTAPYPVLGIVQQTSRGHGVLSYMVAMVAMLFTALSYGKMSSAFPSAGSTYTYASQGDAFVTCTMLSGSRGGEPWDSAWSRGGDICSCIAPPPPP